MESGDVIHEDVVVVVVPENRLGNGIRCMALETEKVDAAFARHPVQTTDKAT